MEEALRRKRRTRHHCWICSFRLQQVGCNGRKRWQNRNRGAPKEHHTQTKGKNSQTWWRMSSGQNIYEHSKRGANGVRQDEWWSVHAHLCNSGPFTPWCKNESYLLLSVSKKSFLSDNLIFGKRISERIDSNLQI